jgi:hypothetical protein
LTKYSFVEDTGPEEPKFDNVVGQEDLTRFDKPKGNQRNKKRKKPQAGGNNQQRSAQQGKATPGSNPQSKEGAQNRNKKRKPNRNKGNDKGPSQKDNS